MRKLVIALTMGVIALAGCGGGSGDGEATAPAPAVEQPSALNVSKRTITINGTVREYFEYVPTNRDELREIDQKGISIVISLHRKGENGEKSAAETRWHELAQEKGFIAIFPNAVGGAWNTSRDNAGADDIAFIDQLQVAVRTEYGGQNSMSYLAGIGQGAEMANAIAMTVPRVAVALAAQSGVAPSAFYDASTTVLKPAALATWMFREGALSYSSAEARQVNYWQQANNVGPTPEQLVPTAAGTIYRNSANPLQQLRITSVAAGARYPKAASQEIWDGLFSKVFRLMDNNPITGTLVKPQSIADMKLTDVSKALSNGSTRRWLEYVPSNYASLTAGGKTVPLLLAYHGRNGSARFMGFITQWHVLAEKFGFIVVYPQGKGATWVTSIAADNTDVADFQALLSEIKSKYAVDTTRIYLTGLSQGSAFTNRVAVQFPELFAAIAPCYSGHLSAAGYANPIVKTNLAMPTYQCKGADEVPSDFPGSEVDGKRFWRETVNRNFGPASIQVDGRMTTEIYTDGLAEYRFTLTKDVGHFWTTGIQTKLWEMLSKYRRLPNGSLALVN